MWGEAFRSVENIQGLVVLGKRQPKQGLMAAYYSRLTQARRLAAHACCATSALTPREPRRAP